MSAGNPQRNTQGRNQGNNRGRNQGQQHRHGDYGRGRASQPVPSPYNFVPLAKDIFFPGWSDDVSMDIPFSDGISGTIEIMATAKTPLYIRNGGAHPDQDQRLTDSDYTDFFRVTPHGSYAIPGTSMKGMIRSVIEIASFGKIVGGKSAPRVADHRYAVRDLDNSSLYGNYITADKNGGFEPKVRSAWLRESGDGKWQIQFCEFSRVEQEDLEKIHPRLNLGRKQSTRDKYNQIPEDALNIRFTPEELTNHPEHTTRKPLRYSKALHLESGETHGTIVFTGQPANRKERGCTNQNGQRCSRGKHMEFIFHSPADGKTIVSDSVKKDFDFAHSKLGENRKPNEEWAFWKSKLHQGEAIPVFVLMDENEPQEIKAIGLAMMFRLPYKNSIHDAIRYTTNDHLDASRLDLAETIFGRVEDKDGLRGRIVFETLVANNAPGPAELRQSITTVLNGPKPTYYPNYIHQDAQNGVIKKRDQQGKPVYSTFMDINAKIRGWKRYIVPENDQPRQTNPVPQNQGRENLGVATRFNPLPTGTTFTGRIRLHNVRPQELGALLWALQWGGNEKLRHMIGMAKPYGYGSLTIDIPSINLTYCNPKKEELVDHIACMQGYIDMMQKQIQGWEKSDQIKALCKISDPASDWPQEVRYPRLADREFVDQKKAGNSLIEAATVGRKTPPQTTEEKSKGKTNDSPPPPHEELITALTKNTLSLKDVQKTIKRLDIDPAKLAPEIRQQIYSKMRKLPGAEANWNFKSETLDKWK